jgi:hypothetical protein
MKTMTSSQDSSFSIDDVDDINSNSMNVINKSYSDDSDSLKLPL